MLKVVTLFWLLDSLSCSMCRDYPCGIGEEYLACAKMVGKILQGVSSSADKIEVRRIGEVDNEMDPVGLVYPADKSIAAVVFPIAESLKQVCIVASKLILCIRIECFIGSNYWIFLEALHIEAVEMVIC